ncbi:MAG TPA: sulfurtransferase-like selenium metabolism protein YedF [Methylomusa anaerophila]|uniref:Sulfur transfer protein SirA n=1 Tax=Methylomusa anaerophila TaxID=1930071 RepID=A0A348AHR0_9FIRM|nr:sulfurtransferase-like selenium metabolism protein YedF [Methylomusa anaerophila]BBB90608.1 sulfur transfer protein SirA [Methylomusa anaerophila]HML88785.1 sulfurtransferase-like selenium metabolism protein YedF [Methylomusa anaerophila]
MSDDKVIDCRGLKCPQPVINTKKTLETLREGRVTVIVDNNVAKENVQKFAVSNGCSVTLAEKNGHYYIDIIKGVGSGAKTVESHTVELTAAGPCPVYLITKNTLGSGSDELGAVLMKSWAYTLRETKPLPSTIMFVNSGVRLTCDGSPILEHLSALADQGVEILSCGTCLDYFGLKEQLKVGSVTNMYTILERLSAGQAITI